MFEGIPEYLAFVELIQRLSGTIYFNALFPGPLWIFWVREVQLGKPDSSNVDCRSREISSTPYPERPSTIYLFLCRRTFTPPVVNMIGDPWVIHFLVPIQIFNTISISEYLTNMIPLDDDHFFIAYTIATPLGLVRVIYHEPFVFQHPFRRGVRD